MIEMIMLRAEGSGLGKSASGYPTDVKKSVRRRKAVPMWISYLMKY
jgi:hypothetical protein